MSRVVFSWWVFGFSLVYSWKRLMTLTLYHHSCPPCLRLAVTLRMDSALCRNYKQTPTRSHPPVESSVCRRWSVSVLPSTSWWRAANPPSLPGKRLIVSIPFLHCNDCITTLSAGHNVTCDMWQASGHVYEPHTAATRAGAVTGETTLTHRERDEETGEKKPTAGTYQYR